MNFFLNWGYELAGIYCRLGSVDAVSVVEAMCKGDGGDEKDKTLDLFGGTCEEEIGVD